MPVWVVTSNVTSHSIDYSNVSTDYAEELQSFLISGRPMTMIEVAMGQVCVLSTSTDLSLTVSCTAALTSPRRTTPLSAVHFLLQTGSKLPIADRPWISFNHSFKFVIELDCRAMQGAPNVDQITGAAAEALEQGKLWSELRLHVASITMTSSACWGYITIVLGQISTAATTPTKSRTISNAPGSQNSVTAHEFVPPGYVETLDLESFYLRITMQRERPTEPPTPTGRPKKRQRTAGDIKPDTITTYCTNPFGPPLVLIDVGIRYAISPLPTRLLDGVSVICEDTFQCMADLAPAIWSPRYCEAVASRMKYLPRISHALGSVGCRDVHNPDLREITSKIARSATRLPQPNDELNRPRLESLIELHFWRTLTRESLAEVRNHPPQLSSLLHGQRTSPSCQCGSLTKPDERVIFESSSSDGEDIICIEIDSDDSSDSNDVLLPTLEEYQATEMDDADDLCLPLFLSSDSFDCLIEPSSATLGI